MPLGELYSQYGREFGASERAVRNYVRGLEFKGMLATGPDGPDSEGKRSVKLL